MIHDHECEMYEKHCGCEARAELRKQLAAMTETADDWAIRAKEAERKLMASEKDCERERLRLAACSTAALGYFNGCADEYRSASLDDVLSLRKKLAAAEKDAARYRWIRSNDYISVMDDARGKYLDVAIDAAMKEAGE